MSDSSKPDEVEGFRIQQPRIETHFSIKVHKHRQVALMSNRDCRSALSYQTCWVWVLN